LLSRITNRRRAQLEVLIYLITVVQVRFPGCITVALPTDSDKPTTLEDLDPVIRPIAKPVLSKL
jgi:hypothetical protein